MAVNRYIIYTSHGRRVFVVAAYSFEAEKKARKNLGKSERVESWAVATGLEKPDPRRDLILP